MACQYIITVGASLLEASCFEGDSRLEALADNNEPLDLKKRQEVKNKTKKLLSACGGNTKKFLKEHPFNNRLWEDNEYHLLGAELATLRKIHRTSQRIKENDTLHLFASKKNCDGGICGSLLEQILKENIFPACSINLHHFNRLDVGCNGDFAKGMEEIYHKAKGIIKGTDADTWLVLSGGYKAMVMMLVQLQNINSRVTVASLHEDTTEGFLIMPIIDNNNEKNSIIKADPEPEINPF